MRICLGITKPISSSWQWQGTSNKTAKVKLDQYVECRHQISHRLSPKTPVTTVYCKEHLKLTYRLAVKTINQTRLYLFGISKKYPWGPYSYKSVK